MSEKQDWLAGARRATLIYTCSACGASVESPLALIVHAGARYWQDGLTSQLAGWFEHEGKGYCPKHKLVVVAA